MMNSVCCLLASIILISFLPTRASGKSNGNQNFEPKIQSRYKFDADKDVVKRVRRGTTYAQLKFVNLSGREVYVVYMDYYRNPIRFMTLRRNEKRAITTRVYTTWYVYDLTTSNYMLMNGKHNHLVQSNEIGRTTTILITSRDGKRMKPPNRAIPEKYLEVMVVTDSTLYKKYGKKTEKYILTIMNAAKNHFLDKSFGFKLHVVVVRVLVIKSQRHDFKVIKNDASKNIRSACDYAAAYNFPSDSDKRHFDFAVVFTRKHFGHTGYSPLFQMCSSRFACTLIQDKGFAIAHVVAHEIAHSLGVEHDGLYNDCDKDGLKGSVMGSVLWARFDNYYWSNCTREQLKSTMGYFNCLNDKPAQNVSRYMTSLPGVHMNRDEQCKIRYADHYWSCNAPHLYYECKHTYCSTVSGEDGRNCAFHSRPPLDGTPCDGGRGWCIKGNCYPTGRFNPSPVHGRWSSWGSWGSCSAECGLGVRYRTRNCDKPRPKYGGNSCTGKRKELKPCNLKECVVAKAHWEERNEYCNSLKEGKWTWFTEQRAMELVSSLGGLNCSFETNCSWVQDDTEEFDWSINKGKTPSEGTGPSEDHTFRNRSGHYMFIEASDGDGDERRKKGFRARLMSPMIKAPQVCFTLYYHMLGSHLGSLQIYKLDSKKQVLLWKNAEDRGDVWRRAQIEISTSRAFEIHIEAVRGVHYQGDIAIDDLTVKFGSCGKTRSVFDTGPCSIACSNPAETIFLVNQSLPDTYECTNNSQIDACPGGKCEWCIKGTCFPYGLFNYAPIHGGWSDWGPWGACSSECNLGIKTRTRQCDNPSPKYDGRHCVGEREDKMACKIKECKIKKTFTERINDYCNSLKDGEWLWFTENRAIDIVTSMPGLNCTFENNCSWAQNDSDDFDWIRNQGKTPSYKTGPSEDHTFANKSGHYLFIEASSERGKAKRERGHKARLTSPLIRTPHVCLAFYYHMFGGHLGSLRVYKWDDEEEVLLWKEAREQGNRWMKAEIDVENSKNFKIHIEAVRGSHYQGDIAIDDLTVRLGSCNKMQESPDKKPCVITCSNAAETAFLRNQTLPDAYPCQSENTDTQESICLGGLCQKVGCDMKIGTTKTLDRCNICGGDNSTC